MVEWSFVVSLWHHQYICHYPLHDTCTVLSHNSDGGKVTLINIRAVIVFSQYTDGEVCGFECLLFFSLFVQKIWETGRHTEVTWPGSVAGLLLSTVISRTKAEQSLSLHCWSKPASVNLKHKPKPEINQY